MNILFVLPQVQRGGGQAVQALNLAEHLMKKGNKIICLTFRVKGISKEIISYIRRLRIYSLNVNLNYKTILLVPFLFNRVRDLIRRHNIDIIQSFDPHLSNFLAVLLGKKMKIPVICRIGAKYREFYEDKLLKGNILTKFLYYSKVISLLLQILEFYTVKQTNLLVSNSNFILKALKQSFLLKNYCLNKIIIPNGVNSKEFSPSIKHLMEVPDNLKDKEIILFVGRIEDYKGIDTLIQAMAHIDGVFSAFHLIILGSYQFNCLYYYKLQELIRSLKLSHKVSFLGEISHKKIPLYLNLARMLILPSYSPSRPIGEGFPNVILEAMSCQRLVIASKIGGIPEIIQHEKNGLLFQPKQYLKLVKLLQEIRRNPDKFDEIAKNGRKDVIKNYSFEVIGKRYMELYSRILKWEFGK